MPRRAKRAAIALFATIRGTTTTSYFRKDAMGYYRLQSLFPLLEQTRSASLRAGKKRFKKLFIG